jgi:hypothetical protein
MVLVFKFGLMEPHIKVCGLREKHLAKENFVMLMEILTKDNGKTIKQMDMGYIYTLKLVLNMKGIGKMICNMAQGFRLMLTEINMKACLNKVKGVEKDLII